MCLARLKRQLINPPDAVLFMGQAERVSEMLATLSQTPTTACSRRCACSRRRHCAVVVDVGARSRRWAGVLALDYWGQDIDIRADCLQLPFADESLDGVISTYVLEHVRHPEQAVAEMYRVLRPGGLLYVETPFMFGYHGHVGSYSDYTRWTSKGLEQLCSSFGSLEIGIAGGPASTIAYVLREGIPILLSSRDSRFYWGLRILLGWLVFPLKYLDWRARKHPRRFNVAAALYCRAVK